MNAATALTSRSAAKRDGILETATGLFAQRGFEQTSMKTLASEAHASTSTIYTYFTDKTDLLDQVIEQRLELVEAGLRAVESDAEAGDDPLDTLLRGLETLHRSVARDPLLPKLMAYEAHVADRRLMHRVQSVLARIDAAAMKQIRRAIDAGVLDCDDPEALLAVSRLSFQGWLVNTSRGAELVSEKRLTTMITTLLRSLRRDAKAST